MKPKTRKTLSIILAISMVLTLFPVGALADEAVSLEGLTIWADVNGSTSTDAAVKLAGTTLEDKTFDKEPALWIGDESTATTNAAIEGITTAWTYTSTEEGATAEEVTEDTDWTKGGTYEVTLTGDGVAYKDSVTASYIVEGSTEPVVDSVVVKSLTITYGDDDTEVTLDPEFTEDAEDGTTFTNAEILPADTEEVTVTAEVENGEITIEESEDGETVDGVFIGTVAFEEGAAELTFDVVATTTASEEEGTLEDDEDVDADADGEDAVETKTYTITLTREEIAGDEYITDIALEGAAFVDEDGEEVEFDTDVDEYDAAIDPEAEEITMTVTLANDVAEGTLEYVVDDEEESTEIGEDGVVDLTEIVEDGTIVTVTYTLDGEEGEEGELVAAYTITFSEEEPEGEYITDIALEGAAFVDEDGEEVEFDAEVEDYLALVDPEAEEITMTVELAEDVAEGTLEYVVNDEEDSTEIGEDGVVDLTDIVEDGTVVTVMYTLEGEDGEEGELVATYSIEFCTELVDEGEYITDIALEGATLVDEELEEIEFDADVEEYDAIIDPEAEEITMTVELAEDVAEGTLEYMVDLDEETTEIEAGEPVDLTEIVEDGTIITVMYTVEGEDGEEGEIVATYVIEFSEIAGEYDDGEGNLGVGQEDLGLEEVDGVLSGQVPENLADSIGVDIKSIIIDATDEDADVDTTIIEFPDAVLLALLAVLPDLDDDFEILIETNNGTIRIPVNALPEFLAGEGIVTISEDPELAELDEEGIDEDSPEEAIILTVDLGEDITGPIIDPPIEIILTGIPFERPVVYWYHEGMFRRQHNDSRHANSAFPLFMSFYVTHCSSFVIIDEDSISEIKDKLDQSMDIDELNSDDDRYCAGADNWVASGYEYYVGNDYTKLVQADDLSEEGGNTYYNIGNVSGPEDVVIAPEGMQVTYYEVDGKLFDGAFVNENNIVAKEKTTTGPAVEVEE